VGEGTSDNTLMPATILDHVTSKMRRYHKETFGRDTARALTVAQRIESGICHVNGPTVHDEAQMPFSGVKGSGMGRFGGKAGIAEFTELRWIAVQTGERNYPF
jgi:acyl-CoA reductase-like NAD-dependent aldehyde dehydrogenase